MDLCVGHGEGRVLGRPKDGGEGLSKGSQCGEHQPIAQTLTRTSSGQRCCGRDGASQEVTGKKESAQRAAERGARRGSSCVPGSVGQQPSERQGGGNWEIVKGRPELVCRLRSREGRPEKARDIQAREEAYEGSGGENGVPRGKVPLLRFS